MKCNFSSVYRHIQWGRRGGALFQSNVGIKDPWILDSDASSHVRYRRSWINEYQPPRACSVISSGDNGNCEVTGAASILIERLVNRQWHRSNLENVLLVPTMKKNLLSVGVCIYNGLTVT